MIYYIIVNYTILYSIILCERGPRNGKHDFRNGALAKTAKRNAGNEQNERSGKTVKRRNGKKRQSGKRKRSKRTGRPP